MEGKLLRRTEVEVRMKKLKIGNAAGKDDVIVEMGLGSIYFGTRNMVFLRVGYAQGIGGLL